MAQKNETMLKGQSMYQCLLAKTSRANVEELRQMQKWQSRNLEVDLTVNCSICRNKKHRTIFTGQTYLEDGCIQP